MNFKKVMAAVLAGTMVFGMASSLSAATEVSFWTLNTRQNAVEPIVEAFNEANPMPMTLPNADRVLYCKD